MQSLKKCVVVVSLSAVLVGAAVSGGPARPSRHSVRAVDGDIVTVIVNLIQLASRISLPPG
jgi:hypothetical protein